MPAINHLKCEIIDGTGEPLQEWGQQKMSKSAISTCFIQSETGRAFKIRVAPDMPFPPVASAISKAEDLDSRLYRERKKRDRAPWNLMASVYFDGRKRPVRRQYIYLDEDNEYFKKTLTMNGCWAPDDQGELWWNTWSFSEAGVELSMDDLSLAPSGKEGQEPTNTADNLASEFGALDPTCEQKEETSKAGLLEVVINRVEISKRAFREKYQAPSDLEAMGSTEKTDKNISHLATLHKANKKEDEMMWCATYHFIDKDPYASFQFRYRSEDQLRKYEFAGFPSKEETKRKQEARHKEEMKRKLPTDAFLDLSLAEKRNKTSDDAHEDEEDKDGTPSSAKRVTTKLNRDSGGDYDADVESDDEEEEEAADRFEMKDGDLAKMKGSEPRKDKENQKKGGLQQVDKVFLRSGQHIKAQCAGEDEMEDSSDHDEKDKVEMVDDEKEEGEIVDDEEDVVV